MDQSLTNMLLWFAVFFGIIYFVIIRPNNKQQKKRRQMLDSVKVKDKVITIGGLHGTVSKITEDTIFIKVANNVELEFLRTAIQTIVDGELQEETNPRGRKLLRRNKEEKVEETVETVNASSEIAPDADKPEEVKLKL